MDRRAEAGIEDLNTGGRSTALLTGISEPVDMRETKRRFETRTQQRGEIMRSRNVVTQVATGMARWAMTIGISAALLSSFVSMSARAADTPGAIAPTVLQDSNTGAVVSTPISPDGRYTVWSSGEPTKGVGLHLTDLKSNSDQVIVKDVDGAKFVFENLDNLSFSPDGSKIAFTVCPPNGSHCHGNKIYTVNTGQC